MISGNLTTIRNNSTKLFDMRYINPEKYGSGDRVNYVLPDLLFSDYGLSLQHNTFVLLFLDGSPILGLSILILFLLYFRDPFLIAEVIWIESFMNLMKAPAQLMTSMPDPYGQQPPCWDPKYGTFGSWVFTRWSISFCGDCIWSYHTWHWIFPMLYIHRFLRQTQICTPAFIWIFRVIVFLWTTGLVLIIVFIQFHYSVDVFLALFLSIFVLTHTPFVEWGANLLYRPRIDELEKEVKKIINKQEYEPPYESMESEKEGGERNDYGSLSSRVQGAPINKRSGRSSRRSDDDFTITTQKQSLSSNNKLQSLAAN